MSCLTGRSVGGMEGGGRWSEGIEAGARERLRTGRGEGGSLDGKEARREARPSMASGMAMSERRSMRGEAVRRPVGSSSVLRSYGTVMREEARCWLRGKGPRERLAVEK